MINPNLKIASREDRAADGLEAMASIVHERDQLLRDNDRMNTDLALSKQKISQLESRLGTASTERDHYMRFATELATHLSTVQDVVGTALMAAKHGAFAPAKVPPPRLPEVDIDAGLENLIKRLPQNGGS